ncbi:DUF4222 domain-containing protein [Winslowiella arboricola]|uniref:DUF4222 domain-containing protein n=1 Tax=Winslowiella arboricola TaxID=2978220 RepID=UPI00225DFCF3|nr:DUF4222 domain-containing protein [Winslowiella arboricola]MCU5775201.1 DUF4222 domain-containing protein [Winslowiella arboricola]
MSQNMNRKYKDHRGVVVTVTRWDKTKQEVIYLREGYEHECMQPLEQFLKKFTRLS